MNILVIGSGGREHALVHAINKSPLLDTLYVCPGNAGINQDATKLDINADDFAAVASACKENNIELVIVGPEAPLVDGITDHLEAEGIAVFGPSKAAAELEGSKAFMKDIVHKYGVPTAFYETFTDSESAKKYIIEQGSPIVVKTDGLAAGKGVTVAETVEQALEAVDELFDGKFGDAGKTVVIEEFLEGEEASFFAICDGLNAIQCGSAQDHKRVGEGDTGPNTGGMGTYSPAPVVTPDLPQKIMDTIIHPSLEGMAKEGKPYKGFLFAGLMIKNGEPKLIEYNIRFGDPEAQSILPRLDTDIVPILYAAAQNKLDPSTEIALKNEAALCVVMAAKGYPASYKKGTEIKNIEQCSKIDGVTVFHAGTALEDEKLTAIGGRVLGVTALGSTIEKAQENAYSAVESIDWEEGFYRRDIGWRAVEKLKNAS